MRHRFNVQLNNQIIKNLGVSVGINSSSAPPYTIRTGLDDNGDLIYNDRPAGVGPQYPAGRWLLQRQPERQLQLGVRPAGRRTAADRDLHQWRRRRARKCATFDAPPRFRVGVFFFPTTSPTTRITPATAAS